MAEQSVSPISRRTFLAGVSAAAAPYIIPAAALGADGETAPSNRVNIGVVGCGGQGGGLMENAIKHKNAHIVAVCDLDQGHLDAAKKKVDEYYGDTACATHHDFRELVARPDIDAVICATPDHWHALVVIEAAKNKKHIYCEKPLTWSLGEGKAVVKAVQEAGVTFQTGSMQRAGSQFKLATELVRNGYLGHIKHINVALPNFKNAIWVDEFPKAPAEIDWDFYVGPAEWSPFHPKRYHWDWRWWMNFGGGQMMDWIGHHGDIAHFAMGWDHTGPLHVEGSRWEFLGDKNNLYNAPTNYEFHCKYEKGVTMTVANAALMPDDFKKCGELGTFFYGDKGKWLYVDRSGIKASDDAILRTEFKKDDFRCRVAGNHMTDFFQCIAEGKECAAPVNAGHRSASIGHLGKIACVLGTSFKWDPKKEEFPDNPALNGILTRRYRGDWKLPA